MTKHLIESILEKDFVSSDRLFRDSLNSIMEEKLLEVKKKVAAEKPLYGTKDNPAKEYWAKYRKKQPKLSHGIDPQKSETKAGGGLTKHGIEKRRERGYIQAAPALRALDFIKRVRKYKETGKLDEQTPIMTQIGAELKGIKKAEKAPTYAKDTEKGAFGVGTRKAKTDGEQPEKEKATTTSGMTKYLRQMHRAELAKKGKGSTAYSVAKQNIGKAFAPEKSLSQRVTSLKRAGKAIGTTTTAKVAKGAFKTIMGVASQAGE